MCELIQNSNYTGNSNHVCLCVSCMLIVTWLCHSSFENTELPKLAHVAAALVVYQILLAHLIIFTYHAGLLDQCHW